MDEASRADHAHNPQASQAQRYDVLPHPSVGPYYSSQLLNLPFFSRQESSGTADRDQRTGQLLDIGLHGLEGPGSAKKSDGIFEKGLKTALESGHVAGGGIPEVKVVANGHCHSKLRHRVFRLRSHAVPQ
jgi:hypothetical protein